ncbi:hypothetical protein JXR74_00580 [Candidatus Mcinerneyibacteriota bacterium]|nr:hypothetical protein [Candidatus Mcinerneyibacteriota bacterium]
MFIGSCPLTGYVSLGLLLLFLLLVAGALLFYHSHGKEESDMRISSSEILEKRLARGEVTENDYKRIKEMIEARQHGR